jgi:hypothetical protein
MNRVAVASVIVIVLMGGLLGFQLLKTQVEPPPTPQTEEYKAEVASCYQEKELARCECLERVLITSANDDSLPSVVEGCYTRFGRGKDGKAKMAATKAAKWAAKKFLEEN